VGVGFGEGVLATATAAEGVGLGEGVLAAAGVTV
jgi:hypothetical protein